MTELKCPTMTDKELRLECLKIASMHYFPRPVGLGMPRDNEIVAIIVSISKQYYNYIETGEIKIDD